MIMSKRKSSKRTKLPRPDDIIGLQDILLEHVLTHRWKDYDQFARTLSLKLLSTRPRTSTEFSSLVLSTSHPFFRFNNINKKQFLQGLPVEALLSRVASSPIPTRGGKPTLHNNK